MGVGRSMILDSIQIKESGSGYSGFFEDLLASTLLGVVGKEP